MNAELNQGLVEALEHCLGQMQQGKLIQDCVAQYPQYPELAELWRTATAIQRLEPLTMPAKQSSRLEQQLLGRFQTMQHVPRKAAKQSRPRAIRYWSFRLVLAAYAFVIVFFMGIGITRASANALPGDNLYGLKRIVEQVELQFSTSETVSNQVYAHIANQRLDEATLLTLQNKSLDMNFISDTLNTLNDAQHYNLSPDIQTLLAQHTLYLSALIKEKPSQTTEMAQFAANLDHFAAMSAAPVIAPEITATATSNPIINTAPISQTPQTDLMLTSVPTATLTATDNTTDQHIPDAKPAHPTQKPLPAEANSNNGKGR